MGMRHLAFEGDSRGRRGRHGHDRQPAHAEEDSPAALEAGGIAARTAAQRWHWSDRWSGLPAALDARCIAALNVWEESEARFAPFGGSPAYR